MANHPLSTEAAAAYAAALKFLKNRDRFESELTAHLERKGYTGIPDAVAVLKSKGILNDEALAVRLAAQNTGRKSVSAERLADKLRAKGASEEAILRATQEHQPNADDLLARFDPGDPKAFAKAARFLSSRGFSEDEIENSLARHFNA